MNSKIQRPIAYIAGIGGGLSHFCAACADAHREDADSDLGTIIDDCVEIVEMSAGTVAICEICGAAIVGSRVESIEDATRRICDSTIGHEATAAEMAILRSLEMARAGFPI
jgi:hypothetical protein